MHDMETLTLTNKCITINTFVFPNHCLFLYVVILHYVSMLYCDSLVSTFEYLFFKTFFFSIYLFVTLNLRYSLKILYRIVVLYC